MPENQESAKQQILFEQALIYLRECHTHSVVLTGATVALNTVALVAGGAFLSFGAALTSHPTLRTKVILITTGGLT
jgi:hypothetical protein